MFPYRDENPTELTPFFTLGLIVLNVAVWVLVERMGADLQASVCTLGLIPVELTHQSIRGPEACALGGLRWAALFTSMFVHGGWLHLLSNMLFLWVFGNNVEDSMGHFRFLAFYLIVGLAASFAHVVLNRASAVPTVGASGAISGVMGAYMILYPRVRVHVFLPPFWFFQLPAYVVLGYWIAIQTILGLADLSRGGATGGVAFWAHIGGFLIGLALVKIFERPQLVTAKREGRHLDRREIHDEHLWW